MRTESERSYRHGFFVNESELRRLYDVSRKRIEERVDAADLRTQLTIKFRNDAIASPTTLDEVLAQENVGSKAIVKLKIEFDDGKAKPEHAITVHFQNIANASTRAQPPISYSILGSQRDWVFVTASDLDERIGRVKKANPEVYVDAFRSGTFLFTMATLFGGLYLGGRTIEKEHERMRNELKEAHDRFKAAQPADTYEALFAVAEVNRPGRPAQSATWVMLLPFGLAMGLMVVNAFRLHRYIPVLFPNYHFYWGGYVEPYEKRQKRTSFVVVGILLALVLGVLGNFLSSWLASLVGKH